MDILAQIGLETKKDWCFYPVGTDSAVLVGIKRKKGQPITVPERIGKLTVRGIDDPFRPGRIGDAFSALDEKHQLAVKKKLENYQLLSRVDLSLLPTTVEYIGHIYLNLSSKSRAIIPSHIHYIRSMYLNALTYELALPASLRYLGKTEGCNLVRLDYSAPAGTTPPQLRLSDYLGYEVEEVFQIGTGAFALCPRLSTLNLGDHIEKIGEDAMPPYSPQPKDFLFNPRQVYSLHLPRQLHQIDSDAFHAAVVTELRYPEDLSESLRRKKLTFQCVKNLTISDLGAVEQYIQLLAKGEDPEHFPDKCLYHLIRCAQYITIPQVLRRIPDGLFSKSQNLLQVNIGTKKESNSNPFLTLNEGVEEIGNEAFYGCDRLRLNPFPNSLRRIGDRAFTGCDPLALPLSEGLTHIGAQAFAGCHKLKTISLPTTLTYLAPDAFHNCPNLRLTPENLEQLSRFPEAQEPMVSAWEQKVEAFMEAGNKYLFRKNVTMADKQAAYEQYRQALELNPRHMSTLYMLDQLLLSCQVPHGITAMELGRLKYFLQQQGCLDTLGWLDGTLSMLDNICIILSDPDDIITQRLVYGLNCDQGAAAGLLEFLLDAVEKHPKITSTARYTLRCITGQLVCSPTRNKDTITEEWFRAQVARHNQLLGLAHHQAEKYNVISRLTSENLMEHFHKAMALPNETGFYDAEFWLELARTFNPKVRIPEAFTKIQDRLRAAEESRKWRAKMDALVFPPEPLLPTPSYTSRRDEEEEARLNELVSEYWAEQAAKQAAAEIESLWGDLADIGFWDDTSWQ